MDRKTSFEYRDSLQGLSGDLPLGEKLNFVHGVVREHLPFIARIAVAVYDPKTDVLKTFLHSSATAAPLVHYEAKLSEIPSLVELVDLGRPRVVNDLGVFSASNTEHTRRLRSQGYGASYTLPMFHRGGFFGFVFFNSLERDVFRPDHLHYLDMVGHLLALTIVTELNNAETLTAAVKTATGLTQQRDPETGEHLERMARYARLIAIAIADKHHLDDEFIERLFLYSPLHDVGKIAIPDKILLKPGKLTAEEREIMKTHTLRGREIIDSLLENFRISSAGGDMLRNVAEYHHEAIDGAGYPSGLSGDDIPIEARIVAVADVFDALTSKRPYKEAWDNDRAFETLRDMAGTQLDRDCVEALVENRAAVEEIQARFKEYSFG